MHLLLKEGKEPLETVMRRICGSYVYWYNRKYGRIGYLFQDRYKSEPVEDNEYLLTVIRYIFHNPIKAQTELDFALNIFNTDREKAMRGFIEHINKDYDDKCLDIQEKQRITDNDARKIIKTQYKIDFAIDIQKFYKIERNLYIKDLKERYGLSIRQIERFTGIGRGVIKKI